MSEATFEKKRIAINLRKEGKTYRKIAEIVGLSAAPIGNAIKAYNKNGGEKISNVKKEAENKELA